MKCELIDTFKFEKRFCRSLLPERMMFQSFGLSYQKAISASLEYFAAAGFIHLANQYRDQKKKLRKAKAWIGKQAVQPILQGSVRKVVKNADKNIALYEANNADLISYIAMVEQSGKELYTALVSSRDGNVRLAGKFGGVLAALTSLDDMVEHRETDPVNGLYNPIITVDNLQYAQEMLSHYKEQVVQMMGDILNNENLAQETLMHQGRFTLNSLSKARPADYVPTALAAASTTGCTCEDTANSQLCEIPCTEHYVTCGGLAVTTILAILCCRFVKVCLSD